MSNPTPKFQVIEGGRPPTHEWTDDEIRGLLMSAIKALPFVKLKKGDLPMWRPESYWHVSLTRNRDQDIARGRQYAVAAVDAMRSDGLNVLHSIFQDMTDAGVEREIEARKHKRSAKRDLVMFGFLNQLGKMFEPKDGGVFRAELDDAISGARALLMEVIGGKDVVGAAKFHVKKLEECRRRFLAGGSDDGRAAS
jgi:hypothetical protein